MAPALDEVSTEYGLLAEAVQLSGGFLLRHLSAARRGEVARRQAGDAGRRDLLVRGVQEEQPAALRLLPPRGQGGEDRASARSPSPSMRRAIASCRRSSASSTCCRSTGGKAPTSPARSATSPRPRSSRRSAAAPTGSRSSCAGRSIVYERVKDYWGKDLNVNVGRDNFDEIRYEYFRDSTVALEAFKADQVDWRSENSAKNWATAYDFPAVQGRSAWSSRNSRSATSA